MASKLWSLGGNFPAGPAGALLYSNGTDWVYLTPDQPGMVLLFDSTSSAPQWVSLPDATNSLRGMMSASDHQMLMDLAASSVQTSRTIATVQPLTGGGDLTANRTFAINPASTSAAGSMSAADKTKLDGLPSSAAPTTRTIATTAPLAGGGDLSADRTLTISAATTSTPGYLSAADKTKLDNLPTTSVGTTRNINTTAPLTGGGNLLADRTLAISAATTSAAGSMSASDKTKLDNLPTSAVQPTRTINTTAPLTGGGDLSADRTFAISAATTAAAGSMSGADKTKLDCYPSPGASGTVLRSNGSVWLAIQPYRGSTIGVTANPTTSSATFATIPEMTLTGTTLGGTVNVSFSTTLTLSPTGLVLGAIGAEIQLFVDGVAVTSTLRTSQVTALASALNVDADPMAFCVLVSGLSAGSHTFEVKWRRVAGTTAVVCVGVQRSLDIFELI